MPFRNWSWLTDRSLWRRVLYGIAMVLILVGLAARPTRAEGVVRFLYFSDPRCTSCQEIHREVIEPLLAQYGTQIEIEEYDLSTADGLERLMDMEDARGVVVTSIPAIILGEDVLIGPEEIRARLPGLIEESLAQGGINTPEGGSPTPAPPAGQAASGEALPEIHIAYFSKPGCDECERSEHDLEYIAAKYPQVKIHRFDVQKDATLNQYLCIQANVPEAKHLTAPSLFVDHQCLLGTQVRAREIEALIAPYLETGLPESWAGWESQKAEAEKTIVERFRSLGLLTIAGAGLLDGVNPCAFATMIFLISYLSIRKRQGAALLATGGAFTAGVFLAYLGVGFGFLRALAALPFLQAIGKWVYGLTAILCLGLAYGSVMDYFKAKAGRLADMTLKLPESLRNVSKRLIREGTGARRFVFSSFLLGLGVSIVELACTGQVYLPTVIFMLGIPEWRTRASLALLIYNVMFILPLIVVFLAVYWGTSSQQLIEWMNRHAAAVKLATAVLFVLLAAWLIASIILL